MNRINLFTDFDSTIVDSVKAYCDAYNALYFEKDGFVEADYTKIRQWNLMDQCPLVKTNNNVEKMFGCQDFWSWLEFMPNAKETLEKLNEDFNLIICSIGTYKNIERKSKWIARNLPFIKNCILINNGDIRMDKSIVDMSDGILIDDVASNLELSNAKYKICFGKIYPWNEALPEGCLRATDWLEVKGILEGVIS